MLSSPVQFIFGSVRFKVNYNWSLVAVSWLCSHSVANVKVIVGDVNVENFPKLDEHFRNIFFRRLRDTIYFKINNNNDIISLYRRPPSLEGGFQVSPVKVSKVKKE